jgi:hypothetical protein
MDSQRPLQRADLMAVIFMAWVLRNERGMRGNDGDPGAAKASTGRHF